MSILSTIHVHSQLQNLTVFENELSYDEVIVD